MHSFKKRLAFEGFLAACIVAGFIHVMYLSAYYGYATQPFIYNTFDTFMDWFNSAFWAWDPEGAYDNWQTVYPPLSFVILRMTTIQSCYEMSPIVARDCDWLGLSTIYIFYAVAIVIIAMVYRQNSRSTWVFRSICMALGLPMLFALERGNFIILTTMLTVLAFSNYLKSVKIKWVLLAIAINLKIYMISTIVAFLLRRKWIALEHITILIVLVYVMSWGILGQGTVVQLIRNLFNFAAAAITGTWQDVYFASSIMSLDRLIKNASLATKILGSPLIELLGIAIPILVRIAQVLTLCAFAVLVSRPTAAPLFRIAALCICLAVTTSESGGYAHAMIICLVLLEEWKGWARPIALVCCYLISIPDEYVMSYVAFPITFSWWSQADVVAQFGIGVGNIARPVLVLIITYCLAVLTIKDGLQRILRDRIVMRQSGSKVSMALFPR